MQGTTTQLRSPTCGTAKHRPEHGTKPDFDIRLIPPYADDHSSCLAQAPSWISRLAAYGPGPSAWSPGSLAHPPASHGAPAVADDRRLQPTGAVRQRILTRRLGCVVTAKHHQISSFKIVTLKRRHQDSHLGRQRPHGMAERLDSPALHYTRPQGQTQLGFQVRAKIIRRPAQFR